MFMHLKFFFQWPFLTKSMVDSISFLYLNKYNLLNIVMSFKPKFVFSCLWFLPPWTIFKRSLEMWYLQRAEARYKTFLFKNNVSANETKIASWKSSKTMPFGTIRMISCLLYCEVNDISISMRHFGKMHKLSSLE